MARGINDEPGAHRAFAGGQKGVCVAVHALATAATEKAILVTVNNEEVWVPKAQIDDDSEVYGGTPDSRGPGKLIVTAWLANKEGWKAVK